MSLGYSGNKWSWKSLMEPVAYLGGGLTNSLVISGLSEMGSRQGAGSLLNMALGIPGKSFFARLIPLLIDGTAGMLAGSFVIYLVCSECYVMWKR